LAFTGAKCHWTVAMKLHGTSGARRIPSGVEAIVYGGLVVGVLDALDAIVVFGLLRGATPIRIFQGIAAGLLGRATFQGGTRTALLGLAIHFFIAFSIVTTYYLASRSFPILGRRPVLWGGLYGVLVYFFMNRVVIPLSAIGSVAFSFMPFINGILIHILGVGIPAALFAARTSHTSLSPATSRPPHVHA
jgi:hypothetical protein